MSLINVTGEKDIELTSLEAHVGLCNQRLKTAEGKINEMIDQHILWCQKWGIPVICSTSIRTEHDGFMKIHKKRGFTVNGSYAWGRTAELLKDMK